MSLASKQSRVSQFKVWIPHEDTEVRSSISASILISAVKVQIATRFVVIGNFHVLRALKHCCQSESVLECRWGVVGPKKVCLIEP